MQWLIDIVLEAVAALGYATETWVEDKGYLTSTYVHRGDPDDYDVVEGDMVDDNNWHELDLSAIVPEGAKAVHLVVMTMFGAVGRGLFLRNTSQIQPYNAAYCISTVGSVLQYFDITQSLDVNRKIDYKIEPTNIFILITVRGWWL